MSVCNNCGKSTIYGDPLLDNEVIGIRIQGSYKDVPIDFCSDKCLKEKFDQLDKYDEEEKQ